jgi:1-acyl-sn-glycerol-3-phosphate acyltransferase
MNVLHTGCPIDNRLSSPVRSLVRLSAYLTLTVALLPIQAIAVLTGTRLSKITPILYHRLCAKIFGFQIRTHGCASLARPTLFVSNHVSYMDITVLGSLLDASFIAKAEVSKWPLFGLLAKLDRTVFVQRRSPRAAEQRDEISGRLSDGDSLILFPEGTSADGLHVLPFKSALFSVAEHRGPLEPLALQPVSISYSHLDGIPLSRNLLPHFAWYGEMTMVSHLFTFVGFGVVTIDVTFHEPALSHEFQSRKRMAEYCHQIVSAGASRSSHAKRLQG